MAFLFDILVTPIDSTTVTTAARPSGMAATAKDTATIKELNTNSKFKLPALTNCTANTKIQITKTNFVKI